MFVNRGVDMKFFSLKPTPTQNLGGNLAKVGKWYPLAERLSRWARIRLLRVVLKKQTQINIARMCGVSRQAVSNWLTKKAYHPNDKNASTLLMLAWRVDKKSTKRILQAEAKRYLLELKKIGIVS